MDLKEANMLQTNPDYICLKRYGNSVERLLKRYPEGCPSHIIADALSMTEDEVEQKYQQIVLDLKGKMGVQVWNDKR